MSNRCAGEAQPTHPALIRKEDHIVLHRLRHGKPLTPTDLSELVSMLLTAGIGAQTDIDRAQELSQGPGRFDRPMPNLLHEHHTPPGKAKRQAPGVGWRCLQPTIATHPNLPE